MLFGSHIFENHGKPSNVNNFELHPTSTDKASTAPLEATRTLCPTAVFGARQESVAVPAAVCPKGADVTMYNDVHNTVNVCWIWRCWLGRVFCILLFTSENREMNRNCLNCHSLCVFLSHNWTKTARKRIRLAGKTTRVYGVAWLSAGTFATRYNLQADHLNLVAQWWTNETGRIREAWNQQKPTKL